MAITLLHSAASAGTGTSSTTLTLTIPATTAGSVLVVSVAGDNDGPSSIAGGSGTFVRAAFSGAHNLAHLWVGTGVSAGTTTITVTMNSATNSGGQVLEFAGVDTASPIGVTTTANGVSAAPAVGPLTPSTTANVIVGQMVGNDAVSAGPSGGFTGLAAYNWVGSRRLATGYLIQSAATAGSTGWTLASSANWDAVLVVLKGAASGGPGSGGSKFHWSTAGTAVVAGAATTVSRPYGSANADTKANVHVGPSDSIRLGQKFLCSQNSFFASIRFSQRWGSGGYSGGSGGSYRIGIQADSAGIPSGTYLASTTYTPGNAGTTSFLNFGIGGSVPSVKGTAYWVVYTNLDAAPGTNYISINEIYVYGSTLVPRQPVFADNELGDWFYTGGSWVQQGRYTPVFDVSYLNGGHDGQGYIQGVIPGLYANITGTTQMAREQFTVSGGDRTVTGAYVRVRRTSGTDVLTVTLETSTGTFIDSITIAAASIPITAPGGDTGGQTWGGAQFGSSHTLTNGQSYRLRLSCAGSSTYTATTIRAGTDSGFAASLSFSDGSGQSTTNSGGTWTDVYTGSPVDLQFYFPVTVPVATGFTATGDSTFDWAQDGDAVTSAGITGTGASTFHWSTTGTAVQTGASGTGVGETVILYTPGSGGLGHAYNRFISTAAGAVHAADEGLFIPGEYYLASYTALGAAVSIATANSHPLQLMAGSSLMLRIRRIRIDQAAVAGTAGLGYIEIRRLTTAGTGGSAITPAKDDGGDGASGATAMTLPTVKGTEGTLIFRVPLIWRQNDTSGGTNTFWEWIASPFTKPLIVPAGTSNGLVIKNITATASATATSFIEFTETNF